MFRNPGSQTRRRSARVGARANDCSGTKRRSTHSFSLAAACISIICLGSATYGGTPQQGLPDGPGKDLVARACSQCHSLDLVTSAVKTQKAWQATVDLMWDRRADFSEADIPKVVNYLYAQFGRDDTTASMPASAKSVRTYDFSKPPARGTIVGSVTSDQGPLRAFRVTAHNLQYRVRYMVYTKQGHYSIPQALPGPYEIFGTETGFSSPT